MKYCIHLGKFTQNGKFYKGKCVYVSMLNAWAEKGIIVLAASSSKLTKLAAPSSKLTGYFRAPLTSPGNEFHQLSQLPHLSSQCIIFEIHEIQGVKTSFRRKFAKFGNSGHFWGVSSILSTLGTFFRTPYKFQWMRLTHLYFILRCKNIWPLKYTNPRLCHTCARKSLW